MLLVPVASSDIAAMGYDSSSTELQIQFTTGRIYSYTNVPPDLYTDFVNAPSKGSFFAQFIKKFPTLYPYKRIDGGVPQLPMPTDITQPAEGIVAASPSESLLETIERFEGLI